MLESLLQLDGAILLWIQEHVRQDFLSPVVKFITHLGDAGWCWILLAVILLIVKKTRKIGLVTAVSLLSSYVVNNLILKNLVARVRPYEAVDGLQRIIEAQSDFSFPSGHSASSFAAAVVIFMLCPRKYGVPALVLAFLIALSRLYVGVHYPTDVLTGVISGTVIAVIVCTVYKKKFVQ
uniref:phosphatase PAP2 family protein n=1 Tax=Roseburia sp. TaxID=2049040 RepID=UPI003FEFD10E